MNTTPVISSPVQSFDLSTDVFKEYTSRALTLVAISQLLHKLTQIERTRLSKQTMKLNCWIFVFVAIFAPCRSDYEFGRLAVEEDLDMEA